jgi:glycyl-tRNA synthetase
LLSGEQYSLVPSPFLLEIGTEELPAGDLNAALDQLRQRVPAWLDELRLEHGMVQVSGTPRRLVVRVDELVPRQPDLEQLIKGPPASRAFGPDGLPTQAGEGFARSKGLSVGDLEVREMDGGQYAVAIVRREGQSAAQVLADALPGLVGGLRFDKAMRWNRSNVYFSRPIRWLLALYGGKIVPFEYAGLASGNTTRGLRFHQPEEIRVHSVDEYYAALEAQGIILNFEHRQAAILDNVSALAAEVGGEIAPDQALLDEVTNLVEAPQPLRGTFDPAHLELPGDVLISVMKKHQRYFPVGKGSQLMPFFIAVRNGDGQGLDTVVDGNEHVIRARFADAAYFVRQDIQKPLGAYLPRLKTLTFQVKLGSMLDKTQRVGGLVDDLAPILGLSDEEITTARRAAELCKADLATNMVVEMTSLQGIMGRHYALFAGEPQAVADAIFEHYLPRYAGDATPASRPGLVVGLADRLATLAGLFAAGLAPTGNKDPFAQRRAALGLVQNIIAWDIDLDLRASLALAAARLSIPASLESQAAALNFIVERLRNVLLEQGRHYDVVDAVLAAQGNRPARAARGVAELSAWTRRPDWKDILPAYARCVRITRDLQEIFPVAEAHFLEPAEADLYAALQHAKAISRRPGSVEDFLQAFTPLIPAISLFFDRVLVMAEDETVRKNRLGLVQGIAALADGVADMSRLEGF